jgi:hypothetical protein
MYIHYLLTIILSLLIVFYPNINKFQINIINSNIYLKLLSILVILLVTLENYLLGILLVIFYTLTLNSNSNEINEGFISYYKEKKSN